MLQNTVYDVTERMKTSLDSFGSTQRQAVCKFSLRTAAEQYMKAVVQSLPRRVETASYIDTRYSWDVVGCEPASLKRVLLYLAEFFHATSDDLYALVLTVRQAAPREATRAEEARRRANEAGSPGGGMRSNTPGSVEPKMLDVTFELRALAADGQPATLNHGDVKGGLELWRGIRDKMTEVTTGASDHGLCLWFAQRLVSSLGGATAAMHGGATFLFVVPYEQPSNPQRAAETEPTPPFDLQSAPLHHRPGVLVVEKCVPLREALMKYFESWYLQVSALVHASSLHTRTSLHAISLSHPHACAPSFDTGKGL